ESGCDATMFVCEGIGAVIDCLNGEEIVLPTFPSSSSTSSTTTTTSGGGGTVLVTGITVSGGDPSVGVGKQRTLTATVTPSNATNKNVTWTTSNSCATVSNIGVVTGVSPGFVTIYATAKDGSGKIGSKTIEITTYHRQTELKNFTSGIAAHNQVPQGFAVGTNYCYSVDVNSVATTSPNTVQRLFRYKLDGNGNGGEPELMTPSKTVGNLGHANDMALATYTESNGTVRYYLYVVATQLNTPALVKLRYDGANYWEVGRYTYNKNNQNLTAYSSISLVKYYTPTSGALQGILSIQFLLGNGLDFFTITIRRDHEGNGSVTPSRKFSIPLPPAHPEYANYGRQAIYYENSGTGKLYYLMWGGNPDTGSNQNHKNVILVYEDTKNAIDNSVAPNYEKRIEINKGSSNSIKFEIEGIGFPANSDVLWFHAYEWNYVPSPNGTGLKGGIYTESRNIK
ncbi:MAG: Ig-like domain-containing protein, partial [Dehalococcoidia bacterium]|nr:Ig-like domain-containing protein [Dehalococcoidia bacterium]